jgi:two-component system sensor histidine kinase YesM
MGAVMNQRISPKPRLQTMFFAAFLLVTGLLVLIVSLFFYTYVSDTLIDQATNALINQSKSFQEQTDAIIQDMDSASINLDYSRSLDSLLSDSNWSFPSVSISKFSDLCTTINGAEVKVDQINLFDYEGNMLQSGAVTKHARYDPEEYPWITAIQETKGNKVLSVPYQSGDLTRYVSTKEWYLSLYRCFYDSYGNNVGVSETIKKCKSVFKNIISYEARSDNSANTYVYNEDGTLLFPYNENTDGKEIYFEAIAGKENGFQYTDPDTSAQDIIAYTCSGYSGWTFVTVQPAAEVLAPAREFTRLLWMLLLVLFLFIIALSWLLSRWMVRPIHRLQNEIGQTGLQNLDQPLQETALFAFREIDELNDTFQSMLQNLNTSMNELLDARKHEERSRLLALQSQINPHFYYNSLASVIALAENDQTEEVIQMCMNLTRIMRYITDTTDVVSIKDEIDYIRKYLYCMKIRYQSSLNYMIDIDPSISSEQIPRLLIQPIVENALKYGIDNDPPWAVVIDGYRNEEGWFIEVMDTGNGFSEEALHTIEERIHAAEQQLGMPQTHINGMGTLNVYLRWKLFCGSQMVFRMENTESGHAKVTIGRLTGHSEKEE